MNHRLIMTCFLLFLLFSLFLWLFLFFYNLWIKIARKHFYKKLTFRLKDAFTSDEHILDMGSGTGFFADMMRNKISGEIFCLDIHKCNKSNAPFIIANACHLPFFDRSFDSITLFYVLHHSDYPKVLLSEVCRVSRNKVIIQEDVYTNLFEKMMCHAEFNTMLNTPNPYHF